jgi:hypothetical protein
MHGAKLTQEEYNPIKQGFLDCIGKEGCYTVSPIRHFGISLIIRLCLITTTMLSRRVLFRMSALPRILPLSRNLPHNRCRVLTHVSTVSDVFMQMLSPFISPVQTDLAAALRPNGSHSVFRSTYHGIRALAGSPFPFYIRWKFQHWRLGLTPRLGSVMRSKRTTDAYNRPSKNYANYLATTPERSKFPPNLVTYTVLTAAWVSSSKTSTTVCLNFLAGTFCMKSLSNCAGLLSLVSGSRK